jgi:hypothetical protein
VDAQDRAANSPDGAAESFRGSSLHILDFFNGSWKPYPFLSGHFGPVSDVTWAGLGIGHNDYFLSVSQDQTCRLFAPWNYSSSVFGDNLRWRELSRPLIHGFDINCVSSVSKNIDLQKFDSVEVNQDKPMIRPGMIYIAADEKVIRAFDCPGYDN